MLITRIVTITALFALTACASSPRYVPADSADDYGHFSRKISEDRYRVNFNGSRHTNLQDTRDYALLRAAELTLAKDYEWFEIVDRETATTETVGYEPRTEFGYERAWYVERNCGLVSCTRSARPATDSSWHVDTGRPDERHSHSIEIRMGKGEMPEDGNYYDAKAVVNAIYEQI